MPVDAAILALARRVGEFHLTDRAMRQAQQRIERAIERDAVDARQREEYLTAVRRYFGPFHDEARTHLRDVDRRLEHVNQVRFNLTAERGVAVKRIEATQSVLDAVERLQQKVAAP